MVLKCLKFIEVLDGDVCVGLVINFVLMVLIKVIVVIIGVVLVLVLGIVWLMWCRYLVNGVVVVC